MNPSFTRALQRILPQLRERPGARCTFILKGQKKPEGKDWAGVNGANYATDSPVLAGYLAEGHNYDVLCGVAGITVAYLDDLARLEELGIIQRIPDIWQIKTGRSGRQNIWRKHGFTSRQAAKFKQIRHKVYENIQISPKQRQAIYRKWGIVNDPVVDAASKGATAQ